MRPILLALSILLAGCDGGDPSAADLGAAGANEAAAIAQAEEMLEEAPANAGANSVARPAGR